MKKPDKKRRNLGKILSSFTVSRAWPVPVVTSICLPAHAMTSVFPIGVSQGFRVTCSETTPTGLFDWHLTPVLNASGIIESFTVEQDLGGPSPSTRPGSLVVTIGGMGAAGQIRADGFGGNSGIEEAFFAFASCGIPETTLPVDFIYPGPGGILLRVTGEFRRGQAASEFSPLIFSAV